MKIISHAVTAREFRDQMINELDRRVQNLREELRAYSRMEGRIAKKRLRELEIQRATLDVLSLWLIDVEFDNDPNS